MRRIMLTERKIEFAPFFFEGNLYVATIDSYWRLTDLLFFYNFEVLKLAKVKPRTLDPERYKYPSFGFYSEYDGELTFGEWIKENKLEDYFYEISSFWGRSQ